jgi:hypothetical protein
MEKAPKRIKATPDSELVHRIKEAISEGVPLVVDAEDASYPLYPDPGKVTVGPKSKRMKDRLMALAGAWSDLDADEMIDRLYKARHASPPSDPIKL